MVPAGGDRSLGVGRAWCGAGSAGLPSGNRNSTAKSTKGKKPWQPRHVVSVWLCSAPPRRAGGPRLRPDPELESRPAAGKGTEKGNRGRRHRDSRGWRHKVPPPFLSIPAPPPVPLGGLHRRQGAGARASSRGHLSWRGCTAGRAGEQRACELPRPPCPPQAFRAPAPARSPCSPCCPAPRAGPTPS